MKRQTLVFGVLVLLCWPAIAQQDRGGEAVFQSVCAACHTTKMDKAPQLGDQAAWQPLLKEGQAVLSGHAWVGVRGMPAQGGNQSLSLAEFSRAVAYMARAAGGNWADPDAAMLQKISREVDKRRTSLKAKQ